MKDEQVKIGFEGHKIDIPVGVIEIPDLQHIAEAVQQKLGKGPAAKILETWRLAHDLRDHIIKRKPAPQAAGKS